MADDKRAYTSGRFELQIGNYNVGYLKKFSGLAMEADIVANDTAPDNTQKKHVANFKWTGANCFNEVIGIG